MFDPIERFPLTSCDLHRTVPSLQSPSFVGSLYSPHPDLLQCDKENGMRVDLDLFGGSEEDDDDDDQSSDGFGVFLPLLESEKKLGLLHDIFMYTNAPGFSVATWVEPDSTPTHRHNDIQEIITLGGQTVFNSTGRVIGCPGYDFQIAQYQGAIMFSFSGIRSGRERCVIVRVNADTNSNKLLHVLMTVEDRYLDVYINGKVAFYGYRVDFKNDFASWNLAESTLQLFKSYNARNDMFRGSIHQVDIFDRYFTISEASELYKQGITYVEPPAIKVVAEANKAFNTRQDSNETSSLILGSLNSTDTVLKLKVEILSLPRHGVLMFNGENSSEVTVNSTLPIPTGSSGVAVYYELPPSLDYFNVPTMDVYGEPLELEPESFEFRVLAFNSNSEPIAISAPVTQEIRVVHVNRVARLITPEKAILDTVDPTSAYVMGIDLKDAADLKYDLSRFRIDVSAKYGHITLHPSFVVFTNFDEDSCGGHQNVWKCHGDGFEDRSMTFTAVPSSIPFILRNLKYQKTDVTDHSEGDNITIRVFDGSGGMCVSQANDTVYDNEVLSTIYDGCFQVESTIQVPKFVESEYPNSNGGPGRNKRSKGGIFGFGLITKADVFVWGIVVCIFGCCSSVWQACCPSCRARGRSIDHDDDDDDDSDMNTFSGSERVA